MLEIRDLHVSVGGQAVLKGVNLCVQPGETFILFGPNGSGKTTLLMTIMGVSGYQITQGQIIFKGQDITHAPMYERARLGIGMSFQRPPTIKGLPTGKLVQLCARERPIDLDAMAQKLNFNTFLERDVNAGFSGGEIKRSELLQLMAQSPDLLLFDEPESGVDLENMALVGHTVHDLLAGKSQVLSQSLREQGRNRKTCGLIITHTGYILQYINAHRGQVMYHGKLCCEANPHEILKHIQEHGYRECLRCLDCAPAKEVLA
ncbi:MAG: ABC transporter ATP-binding protein [Desulfovibrionaceae bacterium]|nr:ABC transporter ATP-binding protein [Desulfovibrionaceae bacterium]